MCPPLEGVAEQEDDREPNIWQCFGPVHVGAWAGRPGSQTGCETYDMGPILFGMMVSMWA